MCAERMHQLCGGRRRCDRVFVDGFGGCGGNVVAMARSGCARVIGVDISQPRLEMCQHNAGIYRVAGTVETRCADLFEQAPHLEVGFDSSACCDFG